ncbi:MAG: cyclic nucleotide-binding domain-containing protein [Deltaproteobacteria bacterium]|nr:cyclic nucleotide-binding domain-containing protein [Deltaproteobacteria bacterium]
MIPDPSVIPFFREMAAPSRHSAFSIFQTSTVSSGHPLIVEGEVGDTMYILVQGRVRIVKSMILKGLVGAIPGLDRPEKVLAVLTDETFPIFGELALVDQDTRSATVEAMTDCTFLQTTRDRFNDLLAREAQAAALILLGVARRLAGTVRRNNGEIVKLTTALALLLGRPSGR